MLSATILMVSIALQFTAAFLAFRLIKTTSHKAWGLVAAAFALMGVRRSISLYRAFESGHISTDFSAELVGLSISMLLVVGVALISPLFSAAARTRESEERASVVEKRFVNAIESISDGFVLYSKNRRLIHCNSRFKDLYGYSDEDAARGVTSSDLGRLDIERNTVVANSDFEKDSYINRREGEVASFRVYDVLLRDGRWLECRDFRTDDGGVISIQSEVTERKLAEEKIRQAHDELELRVKERTKDLDAARLEAEKANQTKTIFLANVSHELRAPLNAVLGFTDMVRKQIFGPIENHRYAEYMENIYESGGHLRELIDDILDISIIEENRLELHEEVMDIEDIIHRSLISLRPRAEKARIRIIEDVKEGLPGFYGDKTRIRQILINLVSNSIKYSGGDGEIKVMARQTGRGDLVIAVADTGIGMNKESIKVALEPFGQIHEVTPAGRGTGLGLPITRKLVLAHGARFDMESHPGKGTTVTMTFPPERMRENGDSELAKS